VSIHGFVMRIKPLRKKHPANAFGAHRLALRTGSRCSYISHERTRAPAHQSGGSDQKWQGAAQKMKCRCEGFMSGPVSKREEHRWQFYDFRTDRGQCFQKCPPERCWIRRYRELSIHYRLVTAKARTLQNKTVPLDEIGH
jgi:hypothetical protein